MGNNYGELLLLSTFSLREANLPIRLFFQFLRKLLKREYGFEPGDLFLGSETVVFKGQFVRNQFFKTSLAASCQVFGGGAIFLQGIDVVLKVRNFLASIVHIVFDVCNFLRMFILKVQQGVAQLISLLDQVGTVVIRLDDFVVQFLTLLINAQGKKQGD